MSLIRPLLYSRPVNGVLRAIAKPFRQQIPSSWHFPVNGVITIALTEGQRIRLAVNPTSFQGKQFFWEGMQGFEPAVHRVFKQLVSSASCFLDIGSNLGLYALLAKTYQPDIRVLAFEPLPAAYSFLQQNLVLNGMDDVQAFPIALSDESGTATFHAPFNPKFGYLKAHLGGTGSLDPDASSVNRNVVNVPTARLDDLLMTDNDNAVDLIKLDTEGTEHMVLDGATSTIRRLQPAILSEVLPGRIEASLDQRLKELDYRAFAIMESGIVAVSSLLNDRRPVNDYLFLPASTAEQTIASLTVPSDQ